ncbi:germ cell-less protein-like 1 [Myotis daubentonii]|uniref:germ cell-less protein-like 1 n=1 Tax=Myotis daubentonii TaxID=98922 RepID=UPI002872EA6E|nr:germ cell-less protein-like 1 [Myotis daubentonii]XP_059535358.1 germ cell-less protein-like 1 [Myotis daubentonii]
MGALTSRLLGLWRAHVLEQLGEGGEEQEAGAMAVVEEVEEESGEGGPTPRQGGVKRKAHSGRRHEQEPPRKRTKHSSGSVYQALFLRGEGSDVQIRALGNVWNLHRTYLCQSAYFASMFSGAWRESTMNTIELQMPDDNIDREALHDALGSLYRDYVLIQPSRVVPILATASMLQLDELIQQCGEIMEETVCVQTVCSYYYAAGSYGLPNIRTMCFQWLLHNLMTHRGDELIREISLDIMEELIVSSELLVIEVEMDVYTMLKKWMYLQLQPTWRGPRGALLSDANLWFARSKRELDGTPFLETPQGRAFVPVFQHLRLAYIVCDLPSARIIDQDALIPATWLTPVYQEQWLALLKAEQTRGLPPTEVHMSNFQRNSMRCGHQVHREEPCSWRWTGFHCSWDLVVCYSNRRFTFRCSALNNPQGLGSSLLWQGNIAFRLCLVSLDRAGRTVFRQDTEYQVLSLGKDEELEVANLENQDVVFPIYVACNFLCLPRERPFQE